jgi:hypothetical protein
VGRSIFFGGKSLVEEDLAGSKGENTKLHSYMRGEHGAPPVGQTRLEI